MHNSLNIIYLDIIDSTNKYALRNFDRLPDAALIAADEQSAGRGRQSRPWISPPHTNIYASAVIKNIGSNPAPASMVMALAALAVVRNSAPAAKFWLKWPNDIFCRERKIAGMLCESVCREGKLVGIVAGIGININMTAEMLSAIDQPATSLLQETGSKFKLKQIIKKLAASLNKYYGIYSVSPGLLFDRWKDENLLIGQTVEVNTGEAKIQGRILNLGRDGELIFETAGRRMQLFSGDVKIDKNSIDFGSAG
ncbi:MAG: biotin--[acetyl-CoA-carboxylase] ligase [Victivallaceae bacterium]|nr:biotin--[acetyl-CoA-carboxylase] ligase [Victivallaceae bacterium]